MKSKNTLSNALRNGDNGLRLYGQKADCKRNWNTTYRDWFYIFSRIKWNT